MGPRAGLRTTGPGRGTPQQRGTAVPGRENQNLADPVPSPGHVNPNKDLARRSSLARGAGASMEGSAYRRGQSAPAHWRSQAGETHGPVGGAWTTRLG